LDGKVYFVGTRPGANRELFVTDGTEEGTVQLTDINPGGSSAITNVVHLNGTLYFRADHVDYGTEIWKLALETPASQEEQAIKNKFHIYPNPAKDFVRLEYQWGSESTAVQHNASLRITDVFGKQVHQARVALPHVLDVGFFAQGVYLVEFIINDERIVARLIVQ
jgi:ELWxxDGT repeat protein